MWLIKTEMMAGWKILSSPSSAVLFNKDDSAVLSLSSSPMQTWTVLHQLYSWSTDSCE
jgi:hypothetical protein